jgi:hypothetical protein
VRLESERERSASELERGSTQPHARFEGAASTCFFLKKIKATYKRHTLSKFPEPLGRMH